RSTEQTPASIARRFAAWASHFCFGKSCRSHCAPLGRPRCRYPARLAAPKSRGKACKLHVNVDSQLQLTRLHRAGKAMRILQFTDLHLRDDPDAESRGVKPQLGFEAVVAHARTHHFPPAAILLTGDLADDEYRFTYPRLAEASRAWNSPVMALPGNHDDGDALRQAFGNPGSVLDLDGWRIIGVNSQAPGAVHGEISEAEWERLETAVLHTEGRHLLVALH